MEQQDTSNPPSPMTTDCSCCSSGVDRSTMAQPLKVSLIQSPPPRPTISVRQFAPGDLPFVHELFSSTILSRYPDPAHEVYYLWRAYTEKRVKTDLADIQATYIATGGNFWVAITKTPESETVVGMVGLERKSEATGEVRSVFVSVNHQRLGIGHKMMAVVLDWALENGFDSLFLTTAADNIESRGFYEKLGFHLKTHSPPLTRFGGLQELVEYAKPLR